MISTRSRPLQNLSSNDFEPRVVINEHQAAVKALAWCPWLRNTLASGGGTADRTIRIWNASLGTNIKALDTGSQVCAIEWNSKHKELLSSHGFSDNQLILWDYPSMSKLKEFRGHTARVLHLAQSPDNETICSASADETLRFWDIFNGNSHSPMKSKLSQVSSTILSTKSNLALTLR
jgi:cell division cycle 20, cofactor of APC complex